MNQAATGKYIAQKRREKNMTQAELGEKLNVSNKAISKWENGKCMPDYNVVQNLCDELEITLAELMDGKDSEKDNIRSYDNEQIIDMLKRIQMLEKKVDKISGIVVLRTVRVIFLIILIIMILISVDLGINAVAAGIPELQDGISYHSFLQTEFGLLEDMGINTRADFFYAFKNSLVITVFVFIINIVLMLWKKKVK